MTFTLKEFALCMHISNQVADNFCNIAISMCPLFVLHFVSFMLCGACAVATPATNGVHYTLNEIKQIGQCVSVHVICTHEIQFDVTLMPPSEQSSFSSLFFFLVFC